MKNKTLYTVTVFSENMVGLLNQVTIIFTRRGLNIETLSVSPSAIEGIHKFTITVFSEKETIDKVAKQIDKRIDILKAYYNVDEDLIYQEIALYKISTTRLLTLEGIENIIRRYNAKILDMTKIWTVLEKTGHYDETQALFVELSKKTGVLQFIRSGRIAVNKSNTERLTDMLANIECKKNETKNII